MSRFTEDRLDFLLQEGDVMQVICVDKENFEWFAPFLPRAVKGLAPGRLIYGAVDEYSETAVGVLMADADGTGLEISWVCVADEWQQRGVARQMICALRRDATQSGLVTRIRAQILGKEKVARKLLESCRFRFDEGGSGEYSFPLSKLSGDAFWKKNLDCSAAVELGKIPENVLREFNRRMMMNDAFMVPLPVRVEDYDPVLSFCYVDGGKIKGMLLGQRYEDRLYLACLYADPDAPRAAAVLLRAAADRANKDYPPETKVSLAAVSPAAEGLAQKLLPGVQPDAILTAEFVLKP